MEPKISLRILHGGSNDPYRPGTRMHFGMQNGTFESMFRTLDNAMRMHFIVSWGSHVKFACYLHYAENSIWRDRETFRYDLGNDNQEVP